MGSRNRIKKVEDMEKKSRVERKADGKREDMPSATDDVNSKLMVLLVVVIYLAILGPLVLHYVPMGTRVFYYYYTNKTVEERQEFFVTKAGLKEVPVNNETHLTVIVHGFSESSHRPWIHRLTKAILSRDENETNGVVIVLDYYDLHSLNYIKMRRNAREVASLIASLLDKLVFYNNLNLSHTHLVGFSMGGRICGMVGERTKSGKIGRITALDPSFPFLHPVTNSESLDASDADLVVVLRTSVVSYFNPSGHIDFYVNGGIVQPGCDDWYFPALVKQGCSHFRAVTMARESVEKGGTDIFPACQCEDWESYANATCKCNVKSNFDMTANSGGNTGDFYLFINADPPYSRPLHIT